MDPLCGMSGAKLAFAGNHELPFVGRGPQGYNHTEWCPKRGTEGSVFHSVSSTVVESHRVSNKLL
jgi:hypothetical protein